MSLQKLLARLASVPVFFALRVACGLVLVKLSASLLPVSGFAEFTQLLLFAAVLNLVAVGGTQNGLIRQAAAAEDSDALATTHTAALMIWAAAVPIVLIPIALGSGRLSTILLGNPDDQSAVIGIAALALLAGPGQIWCSILSGRKWVASSLCAQAAGLLAGTSAAAFLIADGRPMAAAVGFAAGPLLTMAVAFVLAMNLHIRLAPRRAARAAVRPLIRYSAALVATTGYTAVILFGLRSLYRDTFGTSALGYWLAANRVSDMSTQLLGLFLIQFFVAHYATMNDAAERRTFILRCWAGGVALMTTAAATFSIASEPLVRIFLSSAFVPAVPVIQTYMIGDVLRVWTALAMFAAFARGHPGRYAAIEIGTLTVLGAVAVTLIGAGNIDAPQIAYVSAHATTALLVTLFFLWRERARLKLDHRLLPLSWRPRGGRRTSHRGSAAQPAALAIGDQGPSPAVPPRA